MRSPANGVGTTARNSAISVSVRTLASGMTAGMSDAVAPMPANAKYSGTILPDRHLPARTETGSSVPGGFARIKSGHAHRR